MNKFHENCPTRTPKYGCKCWNFTPKGRAAHAAHCRRYTNKLLAMGFVQAAQPRRLEKIQAYQRLYRKMHRTSANAADARWYKKAKAEAGGSKETLQFRALMRRREAARLKRLKEIRSGKLNTKDSSYRRPASTTSSKYTATVRK